MDVTQLLIKLIRVEMTGNKDDLSEGLSYDFDSLLALSGKHSLSHLVADALIKCSLVPDDDKKKEALDRIIFSEAYLFANNENVLSSVREVFESEKIPFIPLKGSVLRDLYPEPWMRTSCDTDILVHRSDLERAVSKLRENGFSTEGEIGFHDIVLHMGKATLELHFTLCENKESVDSLLEKVWDYAQSKSDGYEYVLDRDFFAFYIVSHMAHHMLNGGCGIKPFIDLWLLKSKSLYDEKTLREYCEKTSLLKFYDASTQLIDVWFNNAEKSEHISRFEEYIIRGGTYGTFENLSAVGTAKSHNRLSFIFKHIFLSRKSMEVYYPILKKHPLLLPFMYIKRIIDNVFGRNSKAAKAKMKTILDSDNPQAQDVSALIDELGL